MIDWLNWRPTVSRFIPETMPETRPTKPSKPNPISEICPKNKPPKPPKPSSGGFDGARPGKNQIIERSQANNNDERLESMKRLESAGVCIAVLDTGDMRVLRTEAETLQAIDDGYTIYSPQDMYYYVQLEPHERQMLHDFKKRFGGTVEWREDR
jgi:hypothetical protein